MLFAVNLTPNRNFDKMPQAQNYVILFGSGNEKQAFDLAENMSISQEQDWENENTVFTFQDGSRIYSSGPEFFELIT
jgi:hypothetical protein